MEIFLTILASLFILAGLAGIIAPILPGLPLAWLGVFIYAIGTGFEKMSVMTVVWFFVAMAVIMALDFLAPLLGAKKYRASNWSVLGTFVGTVAGLVFFNVWGLVLGPLAGAFIAELIAKKDRRIAFRAAVGAFVGFVAGTLVKIVYIFVLAGFFIASWF